jgi:hypothetical protein
MWLALLLIVNVRKIIFNYSVVVRNNKAVGGEHGPAGPYARFFTRGAVKPICREKSQISKE